MESEPPGREARKHKFKPKAPPQPVPKPQVKAEKVEDVEYDTTHAKNLMRQFQERSTRVKPKFEKKVQASQIAFGFGAAAASTSLKSYPKGGSANNRNQDSSFRGGASEPGLRQNEYVEPWDYYSYYPVTVPLRRPYSGDPAILDEQEFAEASETNTSDQTSTNPAEGLSLMEENVEGSVFLLKLPSTMPLPKQPAATDGHSLKESTTPSEGTHAIEKVLKINQLPAGFMGKMHVYRSGAVKLKLGDTVFDVFPGMDRIFSQDVVGVNTTKKACGVVAEINKCATITPDVNAVSDSLANL